MNFRTLCDEGDLSLKGALALLKDSSNKHEEARVKNFLGKVKTIRKHMKPRLGLRRSKCSPICFQMPASRVRGEYKAANLENRSAPHCVWGILPSLHHEIPEKSSGYRNPC
jgi:hypothetical protein